MTKKEWFNLKEGDKVEMTLYDHRIRQNVLYKGYVKRSNSNHSQVLIKWSNSDSEHWYGRLGIELTKPQP